MLRIRETRRNERGQALVLALAFIAFFGLVVGAVLNYAGATGLQHANTESTAGSDSRVEGGAAYAAADANRVNTTPPGQSLPAIDCIGQGNTSGTLTMGDGSSVSYQTQNCNPGGSSSGGGLPGTPCILCVLNNVATPFMASNVVLTDNQALSVSGEIDVNGSVASLPKESIQSLGNPPFFAPAFNIMGTCHETPSQNCTPVPTVYTHAISNPLPVCAVGTCPSGTLPAPTGLAVRTASCASPALSPGIYAGISGNCAYTMSSGSYVLTGALSLTGGKAQITGSGVTIYLACSNFPTPCSGGGSPSGIISIGGGGVTSISPPTTGPYNGIVVVADPTMTGTLLSDVGNGDAFSGTVVLPLGDVNVGGGGTGNGVTISGRLIANSVISMGNGKAGSGLTLDGKLFTITSSCTVFDDTVTGTSGGSTNTGRAIIQQLCQSTGLVHLGYSP